MTQAYCPGRGDIVRLAKAVGGRTALTVSPEGYNRMVGWALFCPIAVRGEGDPFEVAVPEKEAGGVILADRIRSLDWTGAEFRGKVSDAVVGEVLGKVGALLGDR